MTRSNDIGTDTASGDGEPNGGMSRRRMIGAAAAGGAAIWVAPSVAGVATAAAQGTPVPCPDCEGAQGTGLIVFGTAFGQDTSPEGDDPECVLNVEPPGLGIEAATVCGHVTSSCSANASVEHLEVSEPIPLTLEGRVLQSNIQVGTEQDCCAVVANATILSLEGDLGGEEIDASALPNPAPNTVLLSATVPLVGDFLIVANRQFCDGDEAVVQALFIQTPLGDIVVAESRVTLPEDCECSAPFTG